MSTQDASQNLESMAELAADKVLSNAEASFMSQFSQHEIELRKVTFSQLTNLNTTIRERSLNTNEKRFLLGVAHGNVRQVCFELELDKKERGFKKIIVKFLLGLWVLRPNSYTYIHISTSAEFAYKCVQMCLSIVKSVIFCNFNLNRLR